MNTLYKHYPKHAYEPTFYTSLRQLRVSLNLTAAEAKACFRNRVVTLSDGSSVIMYRG